MYRYCGSMHSATKVQATWAYNSKKIKQKEFPVPNQDAVSNFYLFANEKFLFFNGDSLGIVSTLQSRSHAQE